MALNYHVKTGAYLPNTKRIFDCYCKAIDYLKEALLRAPGELGKDELEASVTITRVDSDLDYCVKRIFPERVDRTIPSMQKKD